MMPIKEDNQGIIDEGSKNLMLTNRPGLKILVEKYFPISSSPEGAIQKIIAVLNASQVREDHLAESFLLLISEDSKEAQGFIDLLLRRSATHRLARDKAVAEIEEKLEGKNPAFIFEGSKNWSLPIAGSVASIIVGRYDCPVFLYAQGPQLSTGSVRVPKGVDSVKLMEQCKSLLISFGGHPQASGFRLANENLVKFKNCLIKHYVKD